VVKNIDQYFCLMNEDCTTCSMTKSGKGKIIEIVGVIDTTLGIKWMTNNLVESGSFTNAFYMS